ncbi:hypothetical protein LOK49_LG10G01692 [Camellia lanceoleosa]|uniref:Uncharacterized protein n=1 Tax=Camellia lanceoleosa TaxID=1840588 RepID=A0ACC0GAL9_9ERIC|nr:hypothetical protein LOK49_LG10G01692 [Camellia lanceoleosa]
MSAKSETRVRKEKIAEGNGGGITEENRKGLLDSHTNSVEAEARFLVLNFGFSLSLSQLSLGQTTRTTYWLCNLSESKLWAILW